MIIFLLIIIYSLLPIFLFIFSKKTKNDFFIIFLYFINFVITFLFNKIDNIILLKISFIILFCIWLFEIFFLLKKGNYSFLYYAICYISIFNFLKSLFYNINIQTNEALLLSFGYGTVINFLFLVIVYLLYLLYFILLFFHIKINRIQLENLMYILLFLAFTVSGFFLEIPKSILDLFFAID